MNSSGWSQDTSKHKYRTKKPRGSSRKRQLGSTSIEWITPLSLQCHKPRAAQAIPEAASIHATSAPHSGRKTPAAKSTRPNSGQNSRLQRAASNHSLSSSTSHIGLGTVSKPLRLASRPSSSQRPHSKWSTTPSTPANGITAPQGFDLATYIKQNGTAQGIIIGKNGQPTSDNYFDAYLTQCEDELAKEQQTENLLEWEATSVDLSPEELNDRALSHGSVPLCWEEQLTLSECLRCVTPNLSENSLKASKLKLKENLRVKLVLNDQCILERTCIKSLQELRKKFPETTTSVSAATEGRRSPQQQQNHVLEILLYSITQQAQQQLLNHSFDVFVVKSDSTEGGVFEGLTPRRVLSCVSVITVHLENHRALFRTEVESSPPLLSSVSVWFQQSRSLLFSVELQPTLHPPSPNPPQQMSEGFVDQVQQQLAVTRESERPPYCGPPEVPEVFFHKRVSYCNQDEDEDRTDIAVISSYLPELRLIENEVKNDTQQVSPHQPPSVHRELSIRPTTTANTLNYSTTSNKQVPRVIIVPSVSQTVSRHPGVPLKKTWSELLSEEKRSYRKTDNENAFSIIANNWIGRYF